MKATTGVTRKVDDWGRIVIPKKIRRTMRIQDGDELQMFADKNGLIIGKYSAMQDLAFSIQSFAQALYRIHRTPAIVCDTQTIVAAGGIPLTDVLDKPVSKEMQEVIHSRCIYAHSEKSESFLYPIANSSHYVICSAPIVVSDELIGAIFFLSKGRGSCSSATDTEIKLIQIFAAYINEQLEV